jgi:hypothetical protein
MPVQRLRLLRIVASRSETAGILEQPGEALLVQRGRPRILVLMCPCGCGEEITINLDSQAGPAWGHYLRGGSMTVYPSIWRETGCESHFIILRDRIYLFDRYEREEEGDWESLWDEPTIDESTVLQALPTSRLESVSSLAERLDALPWDVLRACRRLAKKELVTEGKGFERGNFRRLPFGSRSG